MYSDLALENTAIKEAAAAKTATPSAKREAASTLVTEHGLSVARACRIVRFSRAAYYRPASGALERDQAVITALQQIVDQHPRSGFWKCFRRLRRQGHEWNHKRVHRVYCALGLNLPRRTRRRLPTRQRQPLAARRQLNGILDTGRWTSVGRAIRRKEVPDVKRAG